MGPVLPSGRGDVGWAGVVLILPVVVAVLLYIFG